MRVDGEDLGLLIGPGGRTLMAVQDLARVAAQRRLGDHDTRHRAVAGLGRGSAGEIDDLAELMLHRQYQAMDWQDRVWAERASKSRLWPHEDSNNHWRK